VRKELYSIKGFLKNPHILIPYKGMLFSAIVIGRVSYYAPLLGSNKERTRSTQTLVNTGLYWIEGFSNRNSYTSLYYVSKELNIPPLLGKCQLLIWPIHYITSNNNIITNNIVNRSNDDNRINISNFLNNECINIYVAWYRWYKFLLDGRDADIIDLNYKKEYYGMFYLRTKSFQGIILKRHS